MAPKAKSAMAPKKKGSLTKGTTKAGSLTKGPKKGGSLTKGTKKPGSPSKGSSAKGSLTKGTSAMKKIPASSSKAMKVMKSFLKKSMLAKLGKMTLAQKINKAAETGDTEEDAAKHLKGMLSKEEHSKAWSKHNVSMSHKSQKEKKEFSKLSKGEKGLQVAMHLLRTNVPRFMQMKESVAQSNSLDKREKWESEAAMIQRFGKDEFWAHVQSGRVAWRHDPWTWGVVNYCDKGDVTLNTQVKKSKAWSRGQEYEPTEEEDAEFDGLWNLDASGHLQQVEGWGKGKSNALTKGKRPWASALISIQRRFTIRGSVGQTIEAFDILLGISSILSRHCTAHLPIQNRTPWNWTHQKIDICFEPGLISVIL